MFLGGAMAGIAISIFITKVAWPMFTALMHWPVKKN